MYFDFDTEEQAADEDLGFMHLKVWEEGASSMQGTYTVPEGFQGAFVARVYNNYEKFTDTEPVTIPDEFLSGAAAEPPAEPSAEPSAAMPAETEEKSENREEEQWNTELDAAGTKEGSGRENSAASAQEREEGTARRNKLLSLVIVSIGALLFIALAVLLVINAVVVSRRRKRRRRRR